MHQSALYHSLHIQWVNAHKACHVWVWCFVSPSWLYYGVCWLIGEGIISCGPDHLIVTRGALLCCLGHQVRLKTGSAPAWRENTFLHAVCFSTVIVCLHVCATEHTVAYIGCYVYHTPLASVVILVYFSSFFIEELRAKSPFLNGSLEATLGQHMLLPTTKEGGLIFDPQFIKMIVSYHDELERPEGTFAVGEGDKEAMEREKALAEHLKLAELSALPRDVCSSCMCRKQVYCGECTGVRMGNAEALLPTRVTLPFDVLLLIDWYVVHTSNECRICTLTRIVVCSVCVACAMFAWCLILCVPQWSTQKDVLYLPRMSLSNHIVYCITPPHCRVMLTLYCVNVLWMFYLCCVHAICQARNATQMHGCACRSHECGRDRLCAAMAQKRSSSGPRQPRGGGLLRMGPCGAKVWCHAGHHPLPGRRVHQYSRFVMAREDKGEGQCREREDRRHNSVLGEAVRRLVCCWPTQELFSWLTSCKETLSFNYDRVHMEWGQDYRHLGPKSACCSPFTSLALCSSPAVSQWTLLEAPACGHLGGVDYWSPLTCSKSSRLFWNRSRDIVDFVLFATIPVAEATADGRWATSACSWCPRAMENLQITKSK